MSSSSVTEDRLRSLLESGLSSLALSLNDQQIQPLIGYVQLLHKWNRVYNLTAVRSMDEMVGRHLLDSLSVLTYLPEESISTAHEHVSEKSHAAYDVLDVGTGAGLPVIPLAIARSDLQFLSVESNGKKTRFQQQVLVELALTNVRVEQARIEDNTAKAHTVISRAFTAPEKFLLSVEKNCTDESRVLIMLGAKEKMPSELPAGFTLSQITHIDVPMSDAARHIAICNKENP